MSVSPPVAAQAPVPPLYGFEFTELSNTATLQALDQRFLAQLHAHSPEHHARLLAYRKGQVVAPTERSALLIACATVLEDFLAVAFGIETETAAARAAILAEHPIFFFKKWLVQRRARRRLTQLEGLADFASLDSWLNEQLQQAAPATPYPDREWAVACLAQTWLAQKEPYAAELERLTQWCVRALTCAAGQAAVAGWVSFHLPAHRDYQQLVSLAPVAGDALARLGAPLDAALKNRDGFKLSDPGMSARAVQGEIDYCVFCHEQAGDFCSTGFPVKKGEPAQGFKTNPLGVTLTGCPLSEKISEMHSLKRDGYTLAALAMVMIDNPLCPATGHRICNDCMKACIYQKQDPVDIPEIETRVLKDVLALPWGVEIYDLLTRWNPLRSHQYLPQPYHGLKVLVAGMGPAGFTLAHHLLMAGFAVVGIDGLKIEPLPATLLQNPVRDWASLEEALDERLMTGFGGVAEYGITVRWNKNFLKLIYLSLLRRPHFQVYGNTRFGGTLTVEAAWALGFDHVAIAVGAGLPQALAIPGSLARGMRQANDFLMALQLTGAAKHDSLTNLQVRLPAVVIGGGLTGLDTATEVQAYYLVQVEKILYRYEILCQFQGEAWVRADLDAESQQILDEWLAHGRALRSERARAAAAGEAPHLQALLQAWGGVTIAYRRSLPDSPAYVSNHEELQQAFSEGIYYRAHLSPVAVRLDAYQHVSGLLCHDTLSGQETLLPARSIFVATGARPNVAYEFERQGTFHREQFQYQPYQQTAEGLQPVPSAAHCKVAAFGPFTSYQQADKRVSFIGDTHPAFHGNVVKAIASGMRTYPAIVALFGTRTQQTGDEAEYQAFRQQLAHRLQTRLVAIKRHTPSVIELAIHAPQAALAFKPGQFFRLQSYEYLAPRLQNTRLQTEAIAVLGAGVDQARGIISVMIIEQGASTRLCATLKPGDPVALMGPTGVRTRIPSADAPETLLFLGGRLGAADIRAVGPALRQAGSRVLYIAGFQSAAEVYCQDDLEAAADVIVWVTATGVPVVPRRPQDYAVTGDYLGAVLRYARGDFHAGQPPIPLSAVDRVLVVGSARLARLVKAAQSSFLAEFLLKQPAVIASVHSSMQCTLKGVCAQCLQWQIDPATGARTKAVFACSWQNQPIEIVDWDNLDERLAQNRVQEHLSNRWLDYVFAQSTVARV